jgi:hypothetical protein
MTRQTTLFGLPPPVKPKTADVTDQSAKAKGNKGLKSKAKPAPADQEEAHTDGLLLDEEQDESQQTVGCEEDKESNENAQCANDDDTREVPARVGSPDWEVTDVGEDVEMGTTPVIFANA